MNRLVVLVLNLPQEADPYSPCIALLHKLARKAIGKESCGAGTGFVPRYCRELDFMASSPKEAKVFADKLRKLARTNGYTNAKVSIIKSEG